MEEKLYDTVEAASFLGLSRETVNLLALRGKLPSRKYGRARLIRETDLIAFKAIDRKPGRPKKPGEGEPDTAAQTPAATPETKARKKASVTAPAAQSKKAAGKGTAAKPAKKRAGQKGKA